MNENFQKKVYLFRFEDCLRVNGNVLLPTTIERAATRRSGSGQYQQNVQFSTNMSEEMVKQRLQEAFPSFNLNERFFCAAVSQASNAFQFHGVPRIWDGRTIRRNLRGNSALNIIIDGPVEPDQGLLQWIQDNLHYDVTIDPAQSHLLGGPPFCIEFMPDLQPEITSGFAIFKKSEDVLGTVELERSRLGDYLSGHRIPAAREPGFADVEIESQDRRRLGTARIFYYLDEEQAKRMVRQPQSFRKLCEDINQQSVDNSNTSAGTAQASLPFGNVQQVQLLCLLVFTAAKEGAQQFVEMIFSCSAGRILFDVYKGSSPLPEEVALEHGNKETARYFKKITKRLSTEKSNGKECPKVIDWSELARAAMRAQQPSDLANELKHTLTIGRADDTHHLENHAFHSSAFQSPDSKGTATTKLKENRVRNVWNHTETQSK